MSSSNSEYDNQGFVSQALSRAVVMRAVKVALVVGTLLALINHGNAILTMSLTSKSLFQVILTYFVPYCVSTWSAVKAIEANVSTTHNK